MPKKRVIKPQREMTRRQLSRWQRQRRTQRLIIGAFIFVLVVVCGTLSYGWYADNFRPLREVIIKVNDTEFKMGYYVKMLKHYHEQLPAADLYSIASYVEQTIQLNELI